MLKNDLYIRALKGEAVERPPVWMMRQAGRYLPEFRALRHKYSFFERVETPELAAEITIQPIDIIGPDAAIIFSDILVIPQALGYEVTMHEGEGPRLPKVVTSLEDVQKIEVGDMRDRLHYVLEAIRLTNKGLDGRVPLIGFAGSPWTILCYMIEGKGSKDYHKAKAFCFTQPQAAHLLLQKITDATIDYLNAQIEAGAHAVQVFDSWGGLLSPQDYETFSMQYLRKIDANVKAAPLVLFGKGCGFALADMAKTSAAALGIDWTIRPEEARRLVGSEITLQGNFDPSFLYAPIPEIEKRTREMLNAFGKDKYIANLGHGILPDIPVAHAQAFVNTVKAS